MNENDLIRRGDALAVADANTPDPAGGPFSHTNSMRVVASDIRKAIAALPAAPLDAPKHLTDALDAALKDYTPGIDRAVRFVSIDQVDMLAEFYLNQRKGRG